MDNEKYIQNIIESLKDVIQTENLNSKELKEIKDDILYLSDKKKSFEERFFKASSLKLKYEIYFDKMLLNKSINSLLLVLNQLIKENLYGEKANQLFEKYITRLTNEHFSTEMKQNLVNEINKTLDNKGYLLSEQLHKVIDKRIQELNYFVNSGCFSDSDITSFQEKLNFLNDNSLKLIDTYNYCVSFDDTFKTYYQMMKMYKEQMDVSNVNGKN